MRVVSIATDGKKFTTKAQFSVVKTEEILYNKLNNGVLRSEGGKHMDKICYLDNSATTPMCSCAKEEMLRAVNEAWGNPSSLHSLGVRAEQVMNSARDTLAKALSCETSEIIFTASGTEANNMAIFGAAQKGAKRGKRVVTTAVEHPSVALCFDNLEKQLIFLYISECY